MKTFHKNLARKRRHIRIFKRITGSAERPRLVVFRSLAHIEGQLVDDTRDVTILGVSSLSKEIDTKGKKKTEVSKAVGRLLAQKAREKGINKIVFDRNGYLYHGRVKAFAEGTREGGLEF
ncbi:MAG TPA: 50S ribosomal protein L18 [Candidatus Glassbacteria bacterium]|nr:50S ribosomal protein L18 [Candidatus Glassbacteria bacterium]